MSSQITNTETREWQALSRNHYLPLSTNYKQLNEKGMRIITKAESVYIWDSGGNKIPDAVASLWCASVDYGREELIQAATRQMRELPFYNLSFQTAHLPVVELAKAIANVAPEGMNHVFFTGSGSETNDTVLHTVRHYWAIRGQPQKKVVIGRRNGYHGSIVADISLGGMKALHEQGDFPIPGIVHVARSYWCGEGSGMSSNEFDIWAAEQLEKKILEVDKESVVVFIAESTQDADGVIVPSGAYWPKIHEILAKYDILFIADEVICGFDRTGKWFGSQHYGSTPDLMPIAKGLTSGYISMGGVVMRDEIVEVLNQGGGFYHGFTYSNHPVAVAVALENICILREEEVTEKVKVETAPYLQKRWQELVDHPLVGGARGVDMVTALELAENKKARERLTNKSAGILRRKHCFRSGLIMCAVGDTTIISPPLVAGPPQVNELITLARKYPDQTVAATLV